jgi:hypothetical protein
MSDRRRPLGQPPWESIVFDFDGATVAQAATTTLTRRGFYVVRSFDLRSALAAHAKCECPHHGAAQCTCQFTVLLVYGDAPQPVTLTIHCRDNQTQAQIAHDATTQPDPQLAENVMTALVEVGLTLHVAPPVAADVRTDAR